MKIEFVEFIPELEQIDRGTLYISNKYGTASHICPCGCDGQVVTPLSGNGWTLVEDQDGVSLDASILNTWCGAHYFIRDNQVVWV